MRILTALMQPFVSLKKTIGLTKETKALQVTLPEIDDAGRTTEYRDSSFQEEFEACMEELKKNGMRASFERVKYFIVLEKIC